MSQNRSASDLNFHTTNSKTDRMLYNTADIKDRVTKLHKDSKEVMICSVSGGMEFIYSEFLELYQEITSKYRLGEHRGIRWVVEVSKENIEIVNKFLDMGIQVRHSPNLPPMNFAVTDTMLNATVEEMKEGRMINSLFATDDPLYVTHFRSIFLKLWESSIPAEEIIADLQKGLNPYNTVIFNPLQIQHHYLSMIQKTHEELLMLLPTPLSLIREDKIGVIHELYRAAQRGVQVRILTEIDDINRKIAARLQEETNIKIRQIRSWHLEAMIKLVVADKAESLTMEIKDGFSENFERALRLATVTTHYPTVLANSAVFENLWEHVEMYERLEHDVKMKDEFINLAAHELRTPILPIILSAEDLADTVDEPQKKNVDAILRNASRLNKLSTAILEASKVTSNSLKLNKENVDVKHLVQSVIHDTYPDMLKGASPIRLVFESSLADNTKAGVDPKMIRQVLVNLLDNAIKFTEQGIITIKVEREADEAVVKVIDSGSGIDPSIKNRLFERFVTRSEKKTGIGLGLFISKGVVQAHGGTIKGEDNTDEKGATFTFTLPLSKPGNAM